MSGVGNEEDGTEECDRTKLAQRRNARLYKCDLLGQDWHLDHKPNECIKSEFAFFQSIRQHSVYLVLSSFWLLIPVAIPGNI